jgi:phage host-nuclease inhibitor protein Gam
MKERREAAAAETELEALQVEMAELEKELADETQKIRDQYDPASLTLESTKLTPVKKNIQVTATGILWLAKA